MLKEKYTFIRIRKFYYKIFYFYTFFTILMILFSNSNENKNHNISRRVNGPFYFDQT